MFGDTTKAYNIPLEHLDYKYISECNKLSYLEKILRVLRSGAEGRYPDLERHCEDKICSINPESRFLRKPGQLLKASDLPLDEREEVENDFQEWFRETNRYKELSKLSIPVVDEDTPTEGESAVRVEGIIDLQSGMLLKQRQPVIKSCKPKTYEEWAKIEKELEVDLEDQENKNSQALQQLPKTVGSGDCCTAAKPSCKGLATKVDAMPIAVRQIHAKREKEKGNEALISGDLREALGYYNRSLVYHPTAAVYNNRALLYLKEKKWRLAVSDCHHVLSKEPKNLKALFRRARAYYELHDLDKSEDDLNQVFSIEPDNKQAVDMLNHVKADRAARKPSNLEGGRRMVIDEDASPDEDEDSEGESETEDSGQEIDELEKVKPPADYLRSVEVSPGVYRQAYRPSSPVRRGVIIEEVCDELNELETDGKAQVTSQTAKIDPSWAGKKESSREEQVNISTKERRQMEELINRLKASEVGKIRSDIGIKLDASMLEQYIWALQKISMPSGDYEFVLNVLNELQASPRFSVACLLLDAVAAGAVRMIFEEIQKFPVAKKFDLTKLKHAFLV